MKTTIMATTKSLLTRRRNHHRTKFRHAGIPPHSFGEGPIFTPIAPTNRKGLEKFFKPKHDVILSVGYGYVHGIEGDNVHVSLECNDVNLNIAGHYIFSKKEYFKPRQHNLISVHSTLRWRYMVSSSNGRKYLKLSLVKEKRLSQEELESIEREIDMLEKSFSSKSEQ